MFDFGLLFFGGKGGSGSGPQGLQCPDNASSHKTTSIIMTMIVDHHNGQAWLPDSGAMRGHQASGLSLKLPGLM